MDSIRLGAPIEAMCADPILMSPKNPKESRENSKAVGRPVVIVVQQMTLNERPRIRKLCELLREKGLSFEIWKFGDDHGSAPDDYVVKNLMNASWRNSNAVIRYLVWMLRVFVRAAQCRTEVRYFAVGFDSALPIACLLAPRASLLFDNIDNVSMSYAWPPVIKKLLIKLECWVAARAELHVNPSGRRWRWNDSNLRIVTNTPSWSAVREAQNIASAYSRAKNGRFTIYLNGWLSQTRGIATLLRAIEVLESQSIQVEVIVAGRPSCTDAEILLGREYVDYLGMLSNVDALAAYFRADLAYIFYDPALEINRLAESQKWTDCWATGTAFVSNSEIVTLKPFVEANACFTVPYSDADSLASLLRELAENRSALKERVHRLREMKFRYWDEAMSSIIDEWSAMKWRPHSGL